MLLQALCSISYPFVNSNWSYSPETPNLGQIRRFLEPCDLKIWRITLNKANVRDLIAATGLVILLKLDSNRRFFSQETPNLGQNRQFFELRDLAFWWMTFKNNRAPLLCYFKLCAAFGSHWWIQTGVTVRKRQIWVKIGDFLSRVTVKFDRWPWKTIGYLFYATSSFVHHFIAIREYKLELFRVSFPLWPWPLTLTFCMDITSVIGNHSWKFHDDTMKGT